MNKQELVRKVQDETGYSQKQIDATLKSLTKTITEALEQGEVLVRLALANEKQESIVTPKQGKLSKVNLKQYPCLNLAKR
jgi:nucleoid DNA-binding protein